MKTPYPLSDHFDGEHFFNPGVNTDKPFSDILKWKSQNSAKKWPLWVENKARPRLPAQVQPQESYLTFINHVTFLIQLKELNILTDPVFSRRTSPFRFAGPKRVRAPGLELENLPPIHLVLVSHNHYDHMDLDSLRKLKQKFDPVFIVPLGNKKYFQALGDEKVTELDWWQNHDLGSLKITLTPAQHWSSRNLWDRRRALWGGFLIQSQDHSLFFAGDTGYGPHFSEIQKRLGPPKISLLPIGAYEPRWFMKASHMNPEDAVLAHRDLQSTLSIPMHFGTWQLTDEAIDEPLQHLQEALQKLNVPEQSFQILEVGETRSFR